MSEIESIAPFLGAACSKSDQSTLENGMLPYWPAARLETLSSRRKRYGQSIEAAAAGFVIPDGLANRLRGALTKIVQGHSPPRDLNKSCPVCLSNASMAQDFAPAAEELYLRRNENGDEGRALLALALYRLEIMPKEQEQLLREIDVPIKARAFDPLTFTSTTRQKRSARSHSQRSLQSSGRRKTKTRTGPNEYADGFLRVPLTQENLWCYWHLNRSSLEESDLLEISDADALLSKNGRSATWLNCLLPEASLTASLNRQNLSYLMRAIYATDSPETERINRGIGIERVVRDLTDPKRTGNPEAPFKLAIKS